MTELTSQALINCIRELRHGPWISPPSEVPPGQPIVIPSIPDTPDVLTPEEMAEYRAKKAAQKAAAKDAPVSRFQQMFQPIYDNPLILPVSELDKKWAAYLKTRGRPEGYPLRFESHNMHGPRRNLAEKPETKPEEKPSQGQEILRNFRQEYLKEYYAAKEKKPKPERPQRNAFSGLSEEIKKCKRYPSYEEETNKLFRAPDREIRLGVMGDAANPINLLYTQPCMLASNTSYSETFFRTWDEHGRHPDLVSTLNVNLPYFPSVDELIAAEKRNQPATPDVDRLLMPPPAIPLPPQPAKPAVGRSCNPKNFHCTVSDCTKSYTRLRGLRDHFNQQHPNLPVPSREQFKHILSNPKNKVDGGNGPVSGVEVDSPATASSVHARDSPAVTGSNESIPASSQSTAIPEPATPSQVSTPAAQLPISSPASTTPKAKAQPKQKIKCAYCRKMYATNGRYQKHLRDVHPAKIVPSSGMQNVIYQPEIMNQQQQNVFGLPQQPPQGTNQDPIVIDLTDDDVTVQQQPAPQQTASHHRPHVRFVQNVGPRRNSNPGMPRPNTVRYLSRPLLFNALRGGVTPRPTGQTGNPARVVAAHNQGQGPRQFIPQAVRGGMPVNLRPTPYESRGVRLTRVARPSMSGGGLKQDQGPRQFIPHTVLGGVPVNQPSPASEVGHGQRSVPPHIVYPDTTFGARGTAGGVFAASSSASSNPTSSTFQVSAVADTDDMVSSSSPNENIIPLD